MQGTSIQILLNGAQVTKTSFQKNVLKNEREKVQTVVSKPFILKKNLKKRMEHVQTTEETLGQNKRFMIFHLKVTGLRVGSPEVILEELKTNFNQPIAIHNLIQ